MSEAGRTGRGSRDWHWHLSNHTSHRATNTLPPSRDPANLACRKCVCTVRSGQRGESRCNIAFSQREGGSVISCHLIQPSTPSISKLKPASITPSSNCPDKTHTYFVDSSWPFALALTLTLTSNPDRNVSNTKHSESPNEKLRELARR